MSTQRPTVLILASDPAFAREITTRWPVGSGSFRESPEFVVLDRGYSRALRGSHYDLAIADASSVAVDLCEPNGPADDLQDNRLRQVLSAAGKPAIIVSSDWSSHHAASFCRASGMIVELRREPGIWSTVVGLAGCEIVARHQAESRARNAEESRALAEAEATLGRFMVEMRTNINNALTTVLGNAELLAREAGLPATAQTQADAICNMAMRLHEIFQRFSSIEKELRVGNRESATKSAHASAGR